MHAPHEHQLQTPIDLNGKLTGSPLIVSYRQSLAALNKLIGELMKCRNVEWDSTSLIDSERDEYCAGRSIVIPLDNGAGLTFGQLKPIAQHDATRSDLQFFPDLQGDPQYHIVTETCRDKDLAVESAAGEKRPDGYTGDSGGVFRDFTIEDGKPQYAHHGFELASPAALDPAQIQWAIDVVRHFSAMTSAVIEASKIAK